MKNLTDAVKAVKHFKIMKETTPITQDEVQHIVPAQHAKTPVLVHRMQPHKGQKVYEFNPKENTLKAVEAEKGTAHYNLYGKKTLQPIRKKLTVDPNCFYITAINAKVALRKIRKIKINGYPIFPNANPKILK